MTKEDFNRITNNATVRLVYGKDAGLLVQGITQSELTELVTLAGQALGVILPEAVINPEWLEVGPAANIQFPTTQNQSP